ncbi:MAG: hypothetical protein JST04_13600 [Bdellovibrionales bacterium]|nr:hypothetical protein [Bdellovibrionales bacterium]
MDAARHRDENCCESEKPKSTGSALKIVSLVSAASAAGLAGIGCLGCIPLVGAAIASTALAAVLDDHLAALQLTLIGLSVAFSLFYFRKRGWPKLQIALAAFAYLILAINSTYLENRICAALGIATLVVSHVVRRKTSSKDDSKLILLFFKGCPNVPVLKSLMSEMKITNFQEIDLETLATDDPFGSFSSPTLLADGNIILGSKTSNSALSCSYTSKEEMRTALTGLL